MINSIAIINTITEEEAHYNLTEHINQRLVRIEEYLSNIYNAINQANEAVITNILIVGIVMIIATIIANFFLIKSFQKTRNEMKAIKKMLEEYILSDTQNESTETDNSKNNTIGHNNQEHKD